MEKNQQEEANTHMSSQLTTYGYDELDRLTSVTYENSKKVVYTYDAAGNRTSVAVTTGAAERPAPEQARTAETPVPAPPPPPPPPIPPGEKIGAEVVSSIEVLAFCPKCGRKNETKARFCSNCGTSLERGDR